MSRYISSTAAQTSAAFALLLIIFLISVGFTTTSLPHGRDAAFSDATISRYPDALYFQRSVRQDRTLPLWNPHLMGGQPFAANPGTKMWYPLTWLLLIWDAAWHINVMTAFHLWLGGIGMWRWGLANGLRPPYALIAGLAYLLSPKLMAHAGAGHVDLLIAAAWMPWFMLSLNHLLTEPAVPKSVLATAFTAAMIFTGAIQLLPFIYGLGAIYTLHLMVTNPARRRNNLVALVAALIFGLAFLAVQWLPLFELREVVSRGQIRQEDAAIFSLEPGQWLGLLIGNHGGNPENMTYAGVSVLVLALLGLLLNPQKNRLWWGAIIFAALYALGENFLLWPALARIFPPLLYFRVPSRAWFIIVFCLPYLAGWGLQTFLAQTPTGARARMAAVALCGVGLTCSLSSLVILADALKLTALIGLFALPLTAILLALRIFDRAEARIIAFLFITLVIVDGLWIDRTLIEGRPRSEWLEDSLPAPLQGITGRIYTPSYAIPQQATAFYDVARFDGVDPFQIRTFIEMSTSATGVPLEGYSTTVPAEVVLPEIEESLQYQDAPMEAGILGQWGVSVVITSYPIQIEGLTLAAQEGERYYYRNEFGWDEAVALEWEGPNRVRQTVATRDPILTVTNAPGWTYEDGTPVASEPVSLPAESGVFVYRPQSVNWGMLLSGLTYALASIWLLWGWWHGR